MPLNLTDNPGLNFRTLGETPLPTRFFIYRDVLDELIYASIYDPRDAFAILLGSRSEDKKNIEINGFDSLQTHAINDAHRSVKSTLNTLTTKFFIQQNQDSETFEASLHRENEAGWFVSQPNKGAKLTTDIMRIHLSLFNFVFLPILVFDPLQKKIALYTQENLRFINVPFTLVSRD